MDEILVKVGRRGTRSLAAGNSSKPIQKHMPDEHKTLEQRIADIEFNLKSFERRLQTRTFLWKERLSLNRTQRNEPKAARLAGFAIHNQFDFRNSAERLKEFPQCAFCYVKGKISDVKLHGDK